MGLTLPNLWHRLKEDWGGVLLAATVLVILGTVLVSGLWHWPHSQPASPPTEQQILARKEREARAAQLLEDRKMAERCLTLRSKPVSELSLDESTFAHNCTEMYMGADGQMHKAETVQSRWRKIWE
jgi:hypothetical protein